MIAFIVELQDTVPVTQGESVLSAFNEALRPFLERYPATVTVTPSVEQVAGGAQQ